MSDVLYTVLHTFGFVLAVNALIQADQYKMREGIWWFWTVVFAIAWAIFMHTQVSP
jgi:hypothetical protein